MTEITRATAFFLTIFLCASSLIAANRPANQERDKESDSCEAYLEREIPRYQVVKHFRTDLKPGLVLHVYVARDDVARQKLIALGCKIGRDHAAEQSLFVYIFDSKRGAKRFDPLGAGNDRKTNQSYLGLYGFSVEAGDAYGQSLNWRPDRRNNPDHWVEIDLGPPPKRPGT